MDEAASSVEPEVKSRFATVDSGAKRVLTSGSTDEAASFIFVYFIC
jgi:hypothetical protein